MRKRAYVQGNEFRGEFVFDSPSGKSAWIGLRSLGYEVKTFQTSKVHEMDLSKNDVVRGSARACRTVLAHLGIPQPKNVDIPESLRKYAGRELFETTVGALKKLENFRPFVKPLEYQKAFSGHIWGDCSWVNGGWECVADVLPNNFKILAQSPVVFLKEWRIYINRGKIEGVSCYQQANPALRLHRKAVKRMIEDYKDAPEGYALDVGYIHNNKELCVVEVNEGFSIGNYGIPHTNFARVIEARWRELVS